jgi:hypothetical protein
MTRREEERRGRQKWSVNSLLAWRPYSLTSNIPAGLCKVSVIVFYLFYLLRRDIYRWDERSRSERVCVMTDKEKRRGKVKFNRKNELRLDKDSTVNAQTYYYLVDHLHLSNLWGIFLLPSTAGIEHASITAVHDYYDTYLRLLDLRLRSSSPIGSISSVHPSLTSLPSSKPGRGGISGNGSITIPESSSGIGIGAVSGSDPLDLGL